MSPATAPAGEVALHAKKRCSCADDLNVCYYFGQTADYYLENKIGHPRIVSKDEMFDRIRKSEAAGNYLCCGHTREIQGLCNCAKCHCGFLMAAKISPGLQLRELEQLHLRQKRLSLRRLPAPASIAAP